MGLRGFAPKPTALKIFEGNPANDKLPIGEPKPAVGEPEMPRFLDAYERKVWRKTVKELLPLGMVTVIDGEMLAAFCVAVAMVRRAHVALHKHGVIYKVAGAGEIKLRPEFGALERMMHQVKTLGMQFGLSPSARSRISVVREEKGDALDAILGPVCTRQN